MHTEDTLSASHSIYRLVEGRSCVFFEGIENEDIESDYYLLLLFGEPGIIWYEKPLKIHQFIDKYISDSDKIHHQQTGIRVPSVIMSKVEDALRLTLFLPNNLFHGGYLFKKEKDLYEYLLASERISSVDEYNLHKNSIFKK